MEDEKMIRAVLAGHALQGLLSRDSRLAGDTIGDARLAIAYADALLVELKKDSPAPAEESPPPGLTAPAGAGEVVQTKWARAPDPGAAWHLWRKDAGEAECGETIDAELYFLPRNTGMDPEHVCLDCKDIANGDGSDAQSAAADAPPADGLHEHRLGKPEDAEVVVRSPLSHRCEAFDCSEPGELSFEYVKGRRAHFCKIHRWVEESILREWHRAFLKARAA